MGDKMVMEEPKVEFVQIDLADNVCTSNDPGPGIETCDGVAPMNQCDENVDFL